MTSFFRALFSAAFVLVLSAQSAFAAKEVALALDQEPPQLNAMKSTDTQSHFVIGHVMEGLVNFGKKIGDYVPGVAERWKIDEKGATFWLRKNALWSDGKPIVAKDFIFGWRTTLDPKTASEYAFFLYPVKNAEAINKGQKPGTELGVEAVDDYTLKITFERPCGYFLGLAAYPSFMPVREDIYKKFGDKYGSDVGNLLYNGPFVLTKWVHGSEMRMEKNPNYWNKGAIKLDAINIPYITADANAIFNFFKDGKTDILFRMAKEDLAKAQQERYKISTFSDGSVFYLEFNFRKGRITTNKNLRKAIQAVFDPVEFVNKIVAIPGTKPGLGFVPVWLKGVSKEFRKEYPMSYNKPNVAKAKAYLAAAMKELGLSKPPTITWLTQDTSLAGREAEYFQNLLKTTLGIDLKIDKQIFKQRLAKMTSGEFDIVSAGWGPDYVDPMTFSDIKASWNENNRGRYANEQYDAQVRKAMASSDPKTRMDAMAAAEKIGMEDVAILPIYERIQAYLVKDRVNGVVRNVIGPDPSFIYSSVK